MVESVGGCGGDCWGLWWRLGSCGGACCELLGLAVVVEAV